MPTFNVIDVCLKSAVNENLGVRNRENKSC